MSAKKVKTKALTNSEEAASTRHANEDGTLMSDQQLSSMKPLAEVLPELAKAQIAGKLSVKPMGRPKSDNPKQSITIRLSSEVTDYFRGTGKGWQTRVDDALLEYVKSHR